MGFGFTLFLNPSFSVGNESHSSQARILGPDRRHGFYKASDSFIPQAVQQASRSVVMVATPFGKKTSVRELFGNRPIPEILKSIHTHPGWSDLDFHEQDSFIYQLTQCAKQPNPHSCQLHGSVKQGSASVIGDGNRLRMTFHSVATQIKERWEHRTTSGDFTAVMLALFIYDDQGNTVYTPADGLAQVVFATAAMKLYEEKISYEIVHPNHDVVDVRLALPIRIPLKFATTAGVPGDRVYQLGYPARTQDRQQYGVPDAPGLALRVTMGEIITPEEAWIKQGQSLSENCEAALLSLSKMTLTNADGGHGMSGGPTLNEYGQILGTFTAIYAKQNKISYSSRETQTADK